MKSYNLPPEYFEETGPFASLFALSLEYDSTHEPNDEISQEDADIYLSKIQKIIEAESENYPPAASGNLLLAKGLMSYSLGRTVKPTQLENLSNDQEKELTENVKKILEEEKIPFDESSSLFISAWLLEMKQHIFKINHLTVKNFNEFNRPFYSKVAVQFLECNSEKIERINTQLQETPIIKKLFDQSINKALDVAIKKEKMEGNFDKIRKEYFERYSQFFKTAKSESTETLENSNRLKI